MNLREDETTGLPYVTLTQLAAESLIRDLLLEKQHCVEVWSSSSGSRRDWSCVKRGSPGNLQDFDDLLHGSESSKAVPMVAAIKLQARDQVKVLGLAMTSPLDRRFLVTEFVDTDLFTTLESLLITAGIKEVVVAEAGDSDRYEWNKIKTVLDKCDVMMTIMTRSDFGTQDLEQDLGRLLSGQTPVLSGPAMGCVACLIRFLALLADDSNYAAYELTTYESGQFMRLDTAVIKALNLFPSPTDGANKTMSVYGVLNHCVTPMGARLLMQWLKQPLLDQQAIENRQRLVESLVESTELRQNVQERLKNVFDLSKLAKRFQRKKGSLQDVLRFYNVVLCLPQLAQDLQDHLPGDDQARQLMEERYLADLKSYLDDLAKFTEMVESTIDLEAAKDHEYRIRADYDEKLQGLHSKMDDLTAELLPEQERVAEELGLEVEKKLKLERNNMYGYFFRISRSDAVVLRNDKSCQELATQKSGVFFTTPTLREISSSYMELNQAYEEQQASLVKDMMTIVVTYCPIMERLNQLLSELDVVTSLAHAACHAPIPYVKPSMSAMGSGDFILREARHPCLELQDDVHFISNDLEMRRGSSEFLIITAPNMAGKSTYIRQAAAIALMAQIGSFVPCSEAQIPIFDCILARVGAGDSQLKGISTFMAEMLDTACILKTASKNSLVVIDELGRGTSTYDGFGLAWAISEEIATHLNSFCLFATHFHELTSLSEEIASVKNLHLASLATNDTIALLYKIREGACDNSLGIHVAEVARFPADVIELAKKKVKELNDGSKHAVAEDEEKTEALQLVDQCMKEFAEIDNLDAMDEDALQSTISAFQERWQLSMDGNALLRPV